MANMYKWGNSLLIRSSSIKVTWKRHGRKLMSFSINTGNLHISPLSKMGTLKFKGKRKSKILWIVNFAQWERTWLRIDKSPNPLLRGYMVNETNLSFHFHKINDHNIRDAICKIKILKGYGSDNVSSYFLKLALLYINNFLVQQVYREKPIPGSMEKGQSYSNFQRWRNKHQNQLLIDFSPSCSFKALQKLVFTQLYQYLNINGLLSSSQPGFRAIHSTIIALLKCTDNCYSALDLRKYLGVVLVDFNTVDCEILLQKLSHCGI